MNERSRFDLFAVAAALWSILLQGHRFGVGNNEIFVAFVRRINDPQWLANDWMMGTAVPHPITTNVLALLCRALPESWAFLLAQIATRCLLYTGAWRLLRGIAPNAGLTAFGLLALAIFQEPRTASLGSHFLHGGTWESAHLGMAAAVWTLAFALRWFRAEGVAVREAVLCGVVGGLACLAHLFIALPVCAVVGIAALAQRRSLASCAVFALAAALVAMPALVPAALGFFGRVPGALSAAHTIGLLQWRHPHHHAPWTWLQHDPITASMLLAFVAAACAYRPVDQAPRTLLLVFAAWFALTGAAFTYFGWKRQVAVLAFFQPFRLFALLWMMAMATLLSRMELRNSLRAAGALLALLLLRFAPASASLAMIVAAWVPAQDTGARLDAWKNRLRASHLAAFAAAALAAILALQTIVPLRQAANRVREHWLVDTEPKEPWRVALRRAIQEEFPTDAVFAIPESLTGFRLVEERAVFLEPKNFPHRAKDLAEYVARLRVLRDYRALGEIESADVPSDVPPLRLSEELIRTLRDEYGVRGIILSGNPGEKDLRLPPDDPAPAKMLRLRHTAEGRRYLLYEVLQDP